MQVKVLEAQKVKISMEKFYKKQIKMLFKILNIKIIIIQFRNLINIKLIRMNIQYYNSILMEDKLQIQSKVSQLNYLMYIILLIIKSKNYKYKYY